MNRTDHFILLVHAHAGKYIYSSNLWKSNNTDGPVGHKNIIILYYTK